MKTCNTIKSKRDRMRKYLNDYIIMVSILKLIEKKNVEEE